MMVIKAPVVIVIPLPKNHDYCDYYHDYGDLEDYVIKNIMLS